MGTEDSLVPAPASVVDPLGRPALGSYSGELPLVSFAGLSPRPPLGTWLRGQKRWHHVLVAGPGVVLAAAIIDIGFGASAFVYVFDRRAGRFLAEVSALGVPRLQAGVADRAGAGARSWFRSPKLSLVLERPPGGDAYRLHGRGRGLQLDVSLAAAAAPPGLAAIAAVPGGVVSCTHKRVGLVASGLVVAGTERVVVDACLAALDHSAGWLARETRWRWACAAGPVGLNLTDGFIGAAEGCVWGAGGQRLVGAATITADPGRPLAPWSIRAAGGAVNLVFTPEGQHREERELGLAHARYTQVFGVFAGDVLGERVEALPGVVEDQAALW